MQERWYLQTKKADFNEIAKQFQIQPIIARILTNRDVAGTLAIREYLHPNIENINSPWLLKDMDKAIDLLKIKISQGNKIRIISDYDVDGICSGYILLRTLKKLGAIADIVVPHRIEDGYGLNQKLIQSALDDNVDLIITCDNGIAAYEQIKYAKEKGMSVIVTDHHEVPFEQIGDRIEYKIPPADAVINQKQVDCTYPFKEMCGAMVAYQLLAALFESMEQHKSELYELLPYVAIATVCDVVDLQGENRTVVKYGIEHLKISEDIGLNALINACMLDKNLIRSYHFGFVLGPCLNATGRLDTAKRAIELLMTTKPQKAKELARELKELNDERKSMTEKWTELAIEEAKGCDDRVLVIYLKECHESIAGIIAGRVKERYNKPTFILTHAKDIVKGSGRSIEAYDMFKELSALKTLFVKFGGHKMAAGLSLKEENIEKFRKAINQNCNLTEEDLYLKVWIDMQLPLEYVTMNLIEQISLLEPFGKANSKPIFAEKELKILKMQIKGKTGNAIRLDIEDSRHFRMTAMLFGRTKEFMAFLKEKYGEGEIEKALEGAKNDIGFMATYYPQINEYQRIQSVQIVIDRFC